MGLSVTIRELFFGHRVAVHPIYYWKLPGKRSLKLLRVEEGDEDTPAPLVLPVGLFMACSCKSVPAPPPSPEG